jgi:hypothetical protein
VSDDSERCRSRLGPGAAARASPEKGEGFIDHQRISIDNRPGEAVRITQQRAARSRVDPSVCCRAMRRAAASPLASHPARARAQGARASTSQAAAMAARQRLKAASTPIIAADAAAASVLLGEGPAAAAARARWSTTACSWRARAPMLLAEPMRKSWKRGVEGGQYSNARNSIREILLRERGLACHWHTFCIGDI